VVSYYDSHLSFYFFVLSSVFFVNVLMFLKAPVAQGKTRCQQGVKKEKRNSKLKINK